MKKKQYLCIVKQLKAKGTYKMGIDYYDNLYSNANYFVTKALNGKLIE